MFDWGGVERIPDEDWVPQPVDAFGLHYDTVENHGWYRNLDLTVEQLAQDLGEGQVLIDYSRGTGILLDRLRLKIGDRPIGMVIVDSSPKFLRIALDRFRSDDRVAFRRLRYLKEARRLQYVDEVLPPGFTADALVSTNAIHVYNELESTLRAWTRVLRPGAMARINSGNIRNPRARENEWIIDDTVYLVHVEYYLDVLRAAGFDVAEVTERTIEAEVEEWYEFLAAYADAVLGWVGGSDKVDGEGASEEAAADRLRLLRESLAVVFDGRSTFDCCWTYISARRA